MYKMFLATLAIAFASPAVVSANNFLEYPQSRLTEMSAYTCTALNRGDDFRDVVGFVVRYVRDTHPAVAIVQNAPSRQGVAVNNLRDLIQKDAARAIRNGMQRCPHLVTRDNVQFLNLISPISAR